jgi:hypothetical protein
MTGAGVRSEGESSDPRNETERVIIDESMPQFHPIIYSLADGGALGKTVEAKDADEACRQGAASILDLSAQGKFIPETERLT